MDDLKHEFSDVEDVKEGSSFVEALAQYYSDFLATDFKKGSLPKRRFQTRDKKGRRSGITLEKFSTFIPVLNKCLAKSFGTASSLAIKPRAHEAQLSSVVLAAIEAEIKRLKYELLHEKNQTSVDTFKKSIKKKDSDLEIESQKFLRALGLNVGAVIGSELINKLEPVFAKSASNLLDALVSVDDDIAELIVSPVEEALPSVLHGLIADNDDTLLNDLLAEVFNGEKIREQLEEYFSAFSAGDLAAEIRELHTLEQLEENLEFYLYLGEVRYQNHEFPLFYVPFKLEFEGATANLNFEPRLLVNKKAVDYIARVIQEKTATQRASPVENRIVYLGPDDTVCNSADDLLEPILRAFQFDGALSFNGKKARLKVNEPAVTVTNSVNFALFDKSDESMLTDYEELLQKLGDGGGELLGFINDLVDGFLTQNPTTIIDTIDNDWDAAATSDRLVFDTPIPLAEEQRKIISALNHKTGRFITVEGPPGTGKSHTISAIAFGAILKGQSILVLSDKKEALDVVENKLNETLAKVRPSDDFVNPILRLGRVGTNFKKIISNKSVDSLRTQHREINKDKEKRQVRYDRVVAELKQNIADTVRDTKKIKLEEVFEFEEAASDFINEWEDELEGFAEIFEAIGDDFADELQAVNDLLALRETCLMADEELVALAENFGEDAGSLALAIDFIQTCKRLADKTGIFESAPDIDQSKLEALKQKIGEIREAKGVFGYLFAGSKLEDIKGSIDRLIGYRPRSNKAEEIISEVRRLSDRADDFYKGIEKQFDDAADLVPDALQMELPKEFNDQLALELKNFQASIDEGALPFPIEGETILEILTAESSGEAEFYEEFVNLREMRQEITEKFELPDYDYLGRKTEIENYNALELATQIDSRVIDFANNYKNDAKTLAQIIAQKKKFPRDKFDLLKQAFPCMICSLRDYAEYIPLERELFDIIIIDEASQVSIAQAFPAILRAKKMIVLGDRRQFGNVKTSNASKELNNAYFSRVKAALDDEWEEVTSDLEIRADKLNISNSILDFMESLSNFEIMLKKHFRGYPEMISFSSKYFYGHELQAMKIRGKPIDEVLEFVKLEHDGNFDIHKNTNEQEANKILELVLEQLDSEDFRSVAVITPFTEQQTLISKVFSEHEKYEEILGRLKFRSFTFDSCQGEERDIIYYSFVANPEKDRLWAVLPKSMSAQDEEELDRNKKLQRMNVAFSRGKEKLIFVHSKPISELSAGREALSHYKAELANARSMPTADDVDPNSEAEKKVLEWIKQSTIMRHHPEIQTQFEIGKYLAGIDKKYRHPMYRVDFLLRFNIGGSRRDVIIEYDGFEYHFDNRSEVDAGNWRHYLTAGDVERELILESYGYKTIRLNKFNVGKDPVETVGFLIQQLLDEFEDPGDALIKQVIEDTAAAHEGLMSGSSKVCKKCDQTKPKSEFENPSTTSGYQRYCMECNPISKKAKKKKRSKVKDGHKKCPNCKRVFPESEFRDRSNASGKRRLCSSCKAVSVQKQREATARYFRAIGKW